MLKLDWDFVPTDAQIKWAAKCTVLAHLTDDELHDAEIILAAAWRSNGRLINYERLVDIRQQIAERKG